MVYKNHNIGQLDYEVFVKKTQDCKFVWPALLDDKDTNAQEGILKLPFGTHTGSARNLFTL